MASRIALVARRKSGKSTVAEVISWHGYERVALATPVKQDVCDMLNSWGVFNGKDDYLTVADIEANKATFRPILEWFGTTFVRDYLGAKTHWIDALLSSLDDDKNYVVDDVRITNEAEALRAAGFAIVRVIRPEAERIASLKRAGEPLVLMPSERDTDAIVPDITLVNVGTLRELAASVGALLRALD